MQEPITAESIPQAVEDSSGITPVVQMPNGACIDPIGKAWRFLRADEGDELMLLYKYAVVLGA